MTKRAVDPRLGRQGNPILGACGGTNVVEYLLIAVAVAGAFCGAAGWIGHQLAAVFVHAASGL